MLVLPGAHTASPAAGAKIAFPSGSAAHTPNGFSARARQMSAASRSMIATPVLVKTSNSVSKSMALSGQSGLGSVYRRLASSSISAACVAIKRSIAAAKSSGDVSPSSRHFSQYAARGVRGRGAVFEHTRRAGERRRGHCGVFGLRGGFAFVAGIGRVVRLVLRRTPGRPGPAPARTGRRLPA